MLNSADRHALPLSRAGHTDRRPWLARAVIVGLLTVASLDIVGYGVMLPYIAGLLVLAGFAIATVAWITRAPARERDAGSWDIAGALVFVGFGAAIVAS